MSDNSNTPVAPWYKQPWLWFILAPLIAVFFYGTFFLYMAITTHDGIVKDDYYKVARGYFVDPTKSQKAESLGIVGTLEIDNLTGDLMLHYKSSATELPTQLILSIISPTHKKYDQSLTLRLVEGSQAYTGNLQAALKGKRYLMLEPQDSSWQLRAEVFPPYDQKTVQLTPNVE